MMGEREGKRRRGTEDGEGGERPVSKQVGGDGG